MGRKIYDYIYYRRRRRSSSRWLFWFLYWRVCAAAGIFCSLFGSYVCHYFDGCRKRYREDEQVYDADPAGNLCDYLYLHLYIAGVWSRYQILSGAGFLQVFIYDDLCRSRTDLLFHESSNGHYGNLWFIYEERDQSYKIC